jgi:hypothetical protein
MSLVYGIKGKLGYNALGKRCVFIQGRLDLPPQTDNPGQRNLGVEKLIQSTGMSINGNDSHINPDHVIHVEKSPNRGLPQRNTGNPRRQPSSEEFNILVSEDDPIQVYKLSVLRASDPLIGVIRLVVVGWNYSLRKS